MRRSYIIIGAIVVVVLLIVAPFWGTYNSLVAQSQGVDAQWAQVQTQYQRRYDLIPNLVNSVKGGMAQERAIFDAIAEARTHYAGAATADAQAKAAARAGTLSLRQSALAAVRAGDTTLQEINRVTFVG